MRGRYRLLGTSEDRGRVLMLNERAEASGFIHVQKGALSIVKMIVHQ